MKRIGILLLASATLAAAPAWAGRADVGGYFRIAARPDLQGGDGKLGYWNLYGRLLNEGPYAAVEMKWDILERDPATRAVWTSLHAKVEGGSIMNADSGNGSLENLRMSQVYVEAGNVGLERVTWRVGTLDTWFGQLGLYDAWPARLFYDTIGVSADYKTDVVDLMLGVGDSGYGLKGSEYDTILTPGGAARFSFGSHLELGLGGEYRHEPWVAGNTHAPYQTPGVDYEDYLRGEVVERWVEENPDLLDYFPDPEGRDAHSWKAVGYLGFGGFGPVRWNNFFVNVQRLHPLGHVTESYQGRDINVYVSDFTDERYQINAGDELQLTLWPHRVEAVWGGLYGRYWDEDNTIAPSDDARVFYSTVFRLQVFMTDTVHLLGETSLAREISTNGNAYREHWDSIFANSGGVPDTRGLEYGDADHRDTWQGKFGVVFNPLGPGIYTRPSLRLLYGVQQSNVHAAFGNAFVQSLDQHNDFELPEQDVHTHHLVALETEVWF
ncbi:MAG: hypothetical protein ABIO70_02740 [Pseudomonadota bacterium]